MTLVVDASVAVKLLVREPGTDQARDLLRIPDALIAPDFLLVEAANTLWKKVKRSELLIVHAERHLATLPDFFRTLHTTPPLLKDAMRLSFRLRHPVYDCLYLALAMREASVLITADGKFLAVIRTSGLAEHARAL